MRKIIGSDRFSLAFGGAFALLVLILPLFAGGFPAHSAEGKSHYSSLDLKKCKVVGRAAEGDGEWVTFRCAGFGGAAVYVTEADLRYSLGYGAGGQDQMSFRQFLGPFNTIGKTLEWRLLDGDVVATILRYFTETGTGETGQILVISRVSGGEACHAAYVDALANKGANVLAQYAADYIAPYFQCGQDEPVHLGKRGVSPF